MCAVLYGLAITIKIKKMPMHIIYLLRSCHQQERTEPSICIGGGTNDRIPRRISFERRRAFRIDRNEEEGVEREREKNIWMLLLDCSSIIVAVITWPRE